MDLSLIRKVDTMQPFEFLVRVNPVNYNYELGLQGISMIGYSFKNFYECGVTINKGDKLEDYNFAYL